MQVLCWLGVSIICMKQTYGKDSGNISGVLGDVMKEQLSIIRHCMTRRCSGNGHSKFENVAFHAYPSRDLTNIPARSRVVFDVVTENTGKAYNSVTGIFNAPYDGVYVFHWTTLIHPGKYFATILRVNGLSKALNHASAGSIKDWYSSNQMYVGTLKKGDKVWLTTDDNVGQYIHKGIYSSFSGFLL